MDARKQVIKEDGAWDIIQDMKTVHVGRGKKTVAYEPNETSKEDILKVSLGRTGNLRAPALRMGTVLYIGYNEAMYEELMA